MPVAPPNTLTAQALDAKFARRQQRYTTHYNISYVHHPAPPSPPEQREPPSPFPAWRAAAERGLGGDGADAGKPPASGAGGAAGQSLPVPLWSNRAAAGRRALRGVLLGTSAVMLLGVLGGIGYAVRSGAVPGGMLPKGSSFAAVVRPLVGSAAQAVARPSPERNAAPPTAQDVATDTPAPPPPAAPNRLALAAPSADKPALAGPPPPTSGPLAVVADTVPVPRSAAPEPVPRAKPSDLPAAPAAAVPLPASAPELATAAVVSPAKVPEPDATLPPPARLATVAEPATVKAVPPASDMAPPVPAIASVTVRLPPAPEWTIAPPVALASLPEAAPPPSAPPALPAAPASPAPPVGSASASAEAAKAAPPGVDAQQVVSTMTLVQQMSLLVHDMHDEGLRYRTELTALTGAVQAKASSLEERLKLAEARNAAGSDAGGPQAGLPGSDAPQVLRGYRVQAGSPGAAVLSDEKASPERAARLLVMVGDQLPGAGRVTAIVQRGRAWIVRTERGVIQ